MAGLTLQARTKKTYTRIAEEALAQDRIEHPQPAYLSKNDYIGHAIRLLCQPDLAYDDPQLVQELYRAREIMKGFEKNFAIVNAMMEEIQEAEAKEAAAAAVELGARKNAAVELSIRKSGPEQLGVNDVVVKESAVKEPAIESPNINQPAANLSATCQHELKRFNTEDYGVKKVSLKQPGSKKHSVKQSKPRSKKRTNRHAKKVNSTAPTTVTDTEPKSTDQTCTIPFLSFPTDIQLQILRHALHQPGQTAVTPRFTTRRSRSGNTHTHPSNTSTHCPSILLASKQVLDLGLPIYHATNAFAIDIDEFIRMPATFMHWPYGFGVECALQNVRRLVFGTNGIDFAVAVGIARKFRHLTEIVFDCRQCPSVHQTFYGRSYDLDVTADLANDLRAGGVNLAGVNSVLAKGGHHHDREVPADAVAAWHGKKAARILLREVDEVEARRKLEVYVSESVRKGCKGKGMNLVVPNYVVEEDPMCF